MTYYVIDKRWDHVVGTFSRFLDACIFRNAYNAHYGAHIAVIGGIVDEK